MPENTPKDRFCGLATDIATTPPTPSEIAAFRASQRREQGGE